MVFTIRGHSQSSWTCSRGDFLHCCGSSARERRQFIHHHPYPTAFHRHAVTSVKWHAKYLKEWSCVTSAVFTTTVTHLFEDQCMKRMSVIQPSEEMRRVTTCCGEAGISWAKNAASMSTSCNQNKNSYGSPKRQSVLLNLVIWQEKVKVQKVKWPLSTDTSIGKYLPSLHLHLVFWVMMVSGTVEIQTQRTCSSLDCEQIFNWSSRHQRFLITSHKDQKFGEVDV